MKDNLLVVKLYKDKFLKNKDTFYIEMQKDEILNIELNGVTGVYNKKSFCLCYFTFYMKDGRIFNVDFYEGYKFKDLINKFNLENEYNRYTKYIKIINEEKEK